MSLLTGIFVYAVLWWMVLFAVLPIAAKRAVKLAASAPTGARPAVPVSRSLLWTTFFAAVLWLLIYGIVTAGLVSFRLAKQP